MKITLSKSQWQLIGKKTGWTKTASSVNDPEIMSSLTEDERNLIRSHLNDLWGEKGKIMKESHDVEEAIDDEN